MFKHSRLPRYLTALLGLSLIPLLAAPASPALAAVDDDRWWDQQLVNADATATIGSFGFANTRPVYFSDDETSVPAGDRYGFLGYSTVPGFFDRIETTERHLRFTNTTGAPFTVTDLSARTVLPELPGDSRTTQVTPDGTDVADTPFNDVLVPAGETVTLDFTTTDTLVSTVRTNSDGRLTGMGTVTLFTATVDGREYTFTETDAFGSVQDVPYFTPNPALSTADFFADCAESSVPSGDLGICGFFGSTQVLLDASFYRVTPPAPEVPETPTPEVPETPAPEVPETPTPEVPETPTPEVPETPTLEIPEPPVVTPPVVTVPDAPTPLVPGTVTPTVPAPEAPVTEPTPDAAPVASSDTLPKTGTDSVFRNAWAAFVFLLAGASLFIVRKAVLKQN
jgi:hypothetical protein